MIPHRPKHGGTESDSDVEITAEYDAEEALRRNQEKSFQESPSPKKDSIMFDQEEANPSSRMTSIELASKKHTCLTTDIPWDVESAKLSQDGKQIAFVTNENGISRLYLADTATGKYRAVSGVPAGVIAHVQWHENNQLLGFVVTSARSPADVYSLDVTSNKIDRWTASETGGIDAATFAEPH